MLYEHEFVDYKEEVVKVQIALYKGTQNVGEVNQYLTEENIKFAWLNAELVLYI